MMIAARLAGGNLFFAFFGWRIFLVGDFLEHSEQLGAARSTRIFLRGILWWGIFGSTRSSSEHSEHSDFFEGICGGGILFFGGWGGVLDCKCWKKLKND